MCTVKFFQTLKKKVNNKYSSQFSISFYFTYTTVFLTKEGER